MIDIICFLLSAILYAVSAVIHVMHWVGGRRGGEYLAVSSLMAAVVLHGVAILSRWIEAGYAPLSSGFEAFSFYAWGLGLLYLIIGSLRRYSVLGVFVIPLALIGVLAALAFPRHIQPLKPILQSDWLPVHVAISFTAYVLFTLAFVAAVAYLLQERTLRHPAWQIWARQLPPLEALDISAHRLALVGELFMTGSLVSGSLWARQAWNVAWVWEPQQVAALVTWVMYAIYLGIRYGARLQRRWTAWLLVCGFGTVLITFVGADLLMSGSRHGFLFGS
jgi:cytochrome c-type biogenesis protein CcsB